MFARTRFTLNNLFKPGRKNESGTNIAEKPKQNICTKIINCFCTNNIPDTDVRSLFYRNNIQGTDIRSLFYELFPEHENPYDVQDYHIFNHDHFYNCMINLINMLNQRYPQLDDIIQIVEGCLIKDITGIVGSYLPKVIFTRNTTNVINISYIDYKIFWNGTIMSPCSFDNFISIPYRPCMRCEVVSSRFYERKNVYNLEDVDKLMEHYENHFMNESSSCIVCMSKPKSKGMRVCNACDEWYKPGLIDDGMDINAHNHMLPLGSSGQGVCEWTCNPCSLLGHPLRIDY